MIQLCNCVCGLGLDKYGIKREDLHVISFASPCEDGIPMDLLQVDERLWVILVEAEMRSRQICSLVGRLRSLYQIVSLSRYLSSAARTSERVSSSFMASIAREAIEV
jgi:hypothetical protein